MTSDALGLPLAGMVVAEITGIEAVAYAGMVLAQMGAAVVKIEPPEGDAVRRRPPFALDPTTRERTVSVPFEFLNAGKSSAIFDSADAEASARTIGLIRECDVVLADRLAMRRLDLELPERGADQLQVFVGPFGGSADTVVESTPLTRLHAGTSGYIIPADLDMSARPGWPGGYVFESIHGVGIALAVVSERSRPTGGVVDYSLQAYGLWLEKLLYSRTSVRGIDFHRNTAVYPYGGNIACSDGYVAIFVIEERQWRGFAAMIGFPQWLEDSRFADGVLRSTNRAPIAAELATWCAERTVDEVIAAGERFDVPMGRVRRPAEVLESAALADRGFFAMRQTGFGPAKVPTLPFGPRLRGSASTSSPTLGEPRQS